MGKGSKRLGNSLSFSFLLFNFTRLSSPRIFQIFPWVFSRAQRYSCPCMEKEARNIYNHSNKGKWVVQTLWEHWKHLIVLTWDEIPAWVQILFHSTISNLFSCFKKTEPFCYYWQPLMACENYQNIYSSVFFCSHWLRKTDACNNKKVWRVWFRSHISQCFLTLKTRKVDLLRSYHDCVLR